MKNTTETSGNDRNITELFGSLVFNDTVMKEMLPEDIYASLHRTVAEGKEIDMNVADHVAKALKDWAIAHGATHYSHWFQPLTGITAEKHESFLTSNPDGSVIAGFTAKNLIKGEPDASSVPSGGLRATFEARGYTSWDPTSYAFIKDNCLCIPTVFRSYSGEVLDMKTPLLRSMELINREALRILAFFGMNDVTRVVPTVGPEQEYFLVDRKMAEKRRDLMLTGRTLFGAKPPKGQELADHYFGAMRPRVKAFMKDLDEELWKLGVYAKTEHNEAAPAQHELAPIFTVANIAADHNQLTMEKMKIIAEKHGLLCLLHEKPFEGVNGSGKHNNWSLRTDTGVNLLRPGKDPAHNKLFLLILTAVLSAVDKHQDLLRIAVASASNDRRLGGNEAPPSVVSVFIGDDLKAILDAASDGRGFCVNPERTRLNSGVQALPDFSRDTTDRNRTAPMAFTGNKFEYRMLGSGFSVSETNVILNTIVADELAAFATRIENAEDKESEIDSIIAGEYLLHRRIVFNGNCYSPEWEKEAEKRGLLNLKTTVDALPYLTSDKNISLFTRNNIYSATEIRSRQEILYDKYCKEIAIEANTMLEMARRQILPAVLDFSSGLVEACAKRNEFDNNAFKCTEQKLLDRIDPLAGALLSDIDSLAETTENAAAAGTTVERAVECRDNVIPAMGRLRGHADSLENLVGADRWPFPTYADLLYGV
ncbi:MAG: glutamine synthetase III [Clostridia bacterium]|nr:glutamine synthetase III [Clostridia bacterium]